MITRTDTTTSTGRDSERGSLTVVALGLLLAIALPCVLLLYNMGVLANASTQSQAIAYNIAYSGQSRAVDDATTALNQSVQMSQQDPVVYHEVDQLAQAAFRQAGLPSASAGECAASKRACVHLEPAPNDPGHTGVYDGSPTITPTIGIINVAVGPEQAISETGFECWNPRGGIVYRNLTNGVVCWVDRRQLDQWDMDQNMAYTHFTSGTEATVRARVPMIGRPFSAIERVGVASFGRPCQTDEVCDQ